MSVGDEVLYGEFKSFIFKLVGRIAFADGIPAVFDEFSSKMLESIRKRCFKAAFEPKGIRKRNDMSADDLAFVVDEVFKKIFFEAFRVLRRNIY